jgi:ABC-2 type transport system ATP-binding protein
MILLDNVTKYFGSLLAVDHLTATINKGEVLGLLGPNGAGKTTTMRMLTGFLQLSEGHITVKDIDVREHPQKALQIMGYLPESAPLYHDMLVLDYLEYVAAIRGMSGSRANERIETLAELCGIENVMHQPIAVLSKGYKQRVGLAHAMMGDPEILVLDEPTSGLDPNQIVEIREIIRQIGQEKTVVLSTHILSEAEATCDRILILHQGKIAADGTPSELKKRSKSSCRIYVGLQNADLEQATTQLGQLPGIETVIQETQPDGTVRLALTTNNETDLMGPIYQQIKNTDWLLMEFYQEKESLESIFRNLTQ